MILSKDERLNFYQVIKDTLKQRRNYFTEEKIGSDGPQDWLNADDDAKYLVFADETKLIAKGVVLPAPVSMSHEIIEELAAQIAKFVDYYHEKYSFPIYVVILCGAGWTESAVSELEGIALANMVPREIVQIQTIEQFLSSGSRF